MGIGTVCGILLQDRVRVDLILPVVGVLFARGRAVYVFQRSDGGLVWLVVVCIVVVFGRQSIVARGVYRARMIRVLGIIAIAVAVCLRNVLY